MLRSLRALAVFRGTKISLSGYRRLSIAMLPILLRDYAYPLS